MLIDGQPRSSDTAFLRLILLCFFVLPLWGLDVKAEPSTRPSSRSFKRITSEVNSVRKSERRDDDHVARAPVDTHPAEQWYQPHGLVSSLSNHGEDASSSMSSHPTGSLSRLSDERDRFQYMSSLTSDPATEDTTEWSVNDNDVARLEQRLQKFKEKLPARVRDAHGLRSEPP